MFADCVTHIHKQFDIVSFRSAKVFGFTTMTMQNVNISDVLKILRTELISQKYSWSHNNNSAWNIHLKSLDCIHDGDKGFSSACWDNHLANIVTTKCINGVLLVGTEFNHQSQSYTIVDVWRLLTIFGQSYDVIITNFIDRYNTVVIS